MSHDKALCRCTDTLLYFVAVPVLEQPGEDDRTSTARLEPLTVVLVVCVAVLAVTAAVLACILCRRRRAAEKRLVVVDEDRESSASLATRPSPLHGHLLYAVTSDDDKLKSNLNPADPTGAHDGFLEGPIRMNMHSIGAQSALGGNAVRNQNGHLFVEGPATRMTSGAVRHRIDGLTQSISEYEIPEDPQWEFPRDR